MQKKYTNLLYPYRSSKKRKRKNAHFTRKIQTAHYLRYSLWMFKSLSISPKCKAGLHVPFVLLSSLGGSDAGFPSCLSPHIGGSLILSLHNMSIATGIRAFNWLQQLFTLGTKCDLPSKVPGWVYIQSNSTNSEKKELNLSGNIHFWLWQDTQGVSLCCAIARLQRNGNTVLRARTCWHLAHAQAPIDMCWRPSMEAQAGELIPCRRRIPRIKLIVDGPEPDTIGETWESSRLGGSWTCMPWGGN